MSLGAVEWETDVSAGDVELRVLASHDDHGCLGVWGVVTGACLGHVDDGGVVEHRAVALGDGLEFGNQCIHLLHVVGFDDVTHKRRTTTLSVTDSVNIGLLLIFGKRGDVCAQVINRVGHHVGKA